MEEKKVEIKKIIVIKRGSVDKVNKDLLNDSGYIVIESDEPDKAYVINGISSPSAVSGEMILNCAIEAMFVGGDSRHAFGEILAKKLRNKLTN